MGWVRKEGLGAWLGWSPLVGSFLLWVLALVGCGAVGWLVGAWLVRLGRRRLGCSCLRGCLAWAPCFCWRCCLAGLLPWEGGESWWDCLEGTWLASQRARPWVEGRWALGPRGLVCAERSWEGLSRSHFLLNKCG